MSCVTFWLEARLEIRLFARLAQSTGFLLTVFCIKIYRARKKAPHLRFEYFVDFLINFKTKLKVSQVLYSQGEGRL